MGNGCIDQNTFAVLMIAVSLASVLLGIGVGLMMAADYLRAQRLSKAGGE